MDSQLARAIQFAENAHKGQKRKYADEDYINHPYRVMRKVLVSLCSMATDDMLCAAMLHDVCEDCNVPFSEIEEKFGKNVADIVEGLTQADKVESHLKLESRAVRMSWNLKKIAKQPWEVKLIKLADRLDNLGKGSITHPEAIGFFRRKYLKESKDLLEVLRDVHLGLEQELEDRIQELSLQLGVSL
jgi:(p)ppGpp synthase/HD superfamily hydrolase